MWDEKIILPEPAAICVTTGIPNNGWSKQSGSIRVGKAKCEGKKTGCYLKRFFHADAFSCAKLYITAHGIFNVYINGKEAARMQLMPGTSQYNKRLMVQTLDVSECLSTRSKYHCCYHW